jgi:indole-3-glycerol phosphate synthase
MTKKDNLMNDMIKKIIERNEVDLLKRKSGKPIEELERKIQDLPKALDFSGAFLDFGIIAEIKLTSPSAGKLASPEEVLEIAGQYKQSLPSKDGKKGGADAISVITEKYFFKGDVNFISPVKEETGLPILQKDFVVDPYQIYESRIAGADALLLIAKIISPDQLKKFVDLCLEVGVEPVVEINDQLDLESASQTNVRIIAVNARDLNTFKVDVEEACELLEKIPAGYLKLGFSGVNSKEEIKKYRNSGARGVLVGTGLIKSPDRKKFLENLK